MTDVRETETKQPCLQAEKDTPNALATSDGFVLLHGLSLDLLILLFDSAF